MLWLTPRACHLQHPAPWHYGPCQPSKDQTVKPLSCVPWQLPHWQSHQISSLPYPKGKKHPQNCSFGEDTLTPKSHQTAGLCIQTSRLPQLTRTPKGARHIHRTSSDLQGPAIYILYYKSQLLTLDRTAKVWLFPSTSVL